ncbi:hypothetical protein CJ010_10885 [Azoarcus sp. DD4]|nr:hypothetical protein CJ010_10885 [Azoarcus sp. DD4]
MRRWLALVLLCLLPLEVSWAVAAEYCTHEHGHGMQHFGHHDDHHRTSADRTDDPVQPDRASLGHHHCHLTAFVGLLGTPSQSDRAGWPSAWSIDEFPRPISVPLAPPERPKWSVPA